MIGLRVPHFFGSVGARYALASCFIFEHLGEDTGYQIPENLLLHLDTKEKTDEFCLTLASVNKKQWLLLLLLLVICTRLQNKNKMKRSRVKRLLCLTDEEKLEITFRVRAESLDLHRKLLTHRKSHW